MLYAQHAKDRGWKVGDILEVGSDLEGYVRYRLTAIGENLVLVRWVANRERGGDWVISSGGEMLAGLWFFEAKCIITNVIDRDVARTEG